LVRLPIGHRLILHHLSSREFLDTGSAVCHLARLLSQN
jgi:hypothetical protein